MATSRTHIIGAGLAGLSAAVRLAQAGRRVVLYEAGPQAGGRCRSYYDEVLGCRIDNGNHLLLSGNRAALDYLRVIGAAKSLTGPEEARFPFVDLTTGERWVVAPNDGPLPLWVFDRSARVPGTSPLDYLSALRLAFARPGQSVEAILSASSPLFRRFWEPLAVAALNTAASDGEAALLWPVLRQTFGRGGAYCRPLIARDGLSESFIDPALAWLKLRGAQIFFGSRIRAIEESGARITGLDLAGEGTITLDSGDSVVVAVPPHIAAALLPSLIVPTAFRPIVNGHFRAPSSHAGTVEIVGVIGGTAEWVFRRGDLISVTVSAADRLVDREPDDLAATLWDDVIRTLDLAEAELPVWRIVKEKRATFAQTTDQVRRRPKAQSAWHNLALAGDWTDTGLPATIEGAIRSGVTAADCVLRAAA